MFIFNKDNGKLINLNKVVDLYCKNNSIKASFETNIGTELATYDSQLEATKALAVIAESIKVSKDASLITVPDKEYIKSLLVHERDFHHRNQDGKKTKGHGGS